MKEHPILFSAEMVRAILAGRKTQTRRIIKPQPELRGGVWHWKNIAWDTANAQISDEFIIDHCPYGTVGDTLWVREAFATDIPGCEEQSGITYRADHIDPKGDGPANPIKWKPSIHMPRWASRISLEITDIQVERVQDISDSDVYAEGLPEDGSSYDDAIQALSAGLPIHERTPERHWFRGLWDSINAKRGYGWDSNPWVLVIHFKKVKP